jgi:hypothetical protein
VRDALRGRDVGEGRAVRALGDAQRVRAVHAEVGGVLDAHVERARALATNDARELLSCALRSSFEATTVTWSGAKTVSVVFASERSSVVSTT